MSLKIINEMTLEDYQPDSNAESTLAIITNQGKLSLFESVLEDLYPDGISEQDLDDLLWHDRDQVLGWCGIPTEDELNEEYQGILDQFEDDMDEVKMELIDILEGAESDVPMDEFDAEWDRLFNVLKEKYHGAILEVRENRGKYSDY